jgi:hypothetical protein
MKSPFTTSKETGIKSWLPLPDDIYILTGVDRNRKRFKITSTSYRYIRSINAWQGSLWLSRHGRRFLITKIIN